MDAAASLRLRRLWSAVALAPSRTSPDPSASEGPGPSSSSPGPCASPRFAASWPGGRRRGQPSGLPARWARAEMSQATRDALRSAGGAIELIFAKRLARVELVGQTVPLPHVHGWHTCGNARGLVRTLSQQRRGVWQRKPFCRGRCLFRSTDRM